MNSRSTLLPDEPPLDPARRAADRALLKKIQGNVLQPHGRDYVRLVLFQFTDDGPGLRIFFPDALREKLVTNAFEQWDEGRAVSAGSAAGDTPFFSVAVSQPGMVRCGYGPEDWPGPLEAGFQTPMDAAHEFRALGDAPVGAAADAGPDWEPGYRDQPHGVWLLAHRDRRALDGMERTIRAFLAAHRAKVTATEYGRRWRDAEQPEKLQREPFGFLDCVSQSEFFAGPDYDRTPKWVRLPRARVLLPEVDERDHPGQSQHAFGSFLVLRKLEQNVAAFRAFEEELRPQLTGAAACPHDPGALLIGRARDGTPLAPLNPRARGPDDFEFGIDVTRCPFHAHIRKANPRLAGDVAPFTDEFVRSVLFPRRGVVYDDNDPPRLPECASPHYPEGATLGADSKVGLLFMAYMSSLAQFGALQKNWFGNPNFPVPGTNFGDALLRPDVVAPPDAPAPFAWEWQGVRVKSVPQFVRPRGGAYFYVPSIAWLAAQQAPEIRARPRRALAHQS
jgi:deferrochelatase/peroxidase EfeB